MNSSKLSPFGGQNGPQENCLQRAGYEEPAGIADGNGTETAVLPVNGSLIYD